MSAGRPARTAVREFVHPWPPRGRVLTRPEPGAVGLWLLRLPEMVPRLAAEGALDVLDPEERRRRAAFLGPVDRDRYTAAHVGLRRLLGMYLDRDPATVPLDRQPCPHCGEPHGRPAVIGSGLHFSLSYSVDLALIAVAADLVGVDVEAVPRPGVAEEVSPALHPLERTELTALPVSERQAAFTRCWVRKEAYAKGSGQGLGGGADSGYAGTGPVPAPVPGWTLADIPVPPGYAAALALRRAHGQGRPMGDHEGLAYRRWTVETGTDDSSFCQI